MTALLKFGTLDLTEYTTIVDTILPNTINAQAIQGRHGVLITDSVTASVTLIRARGTITGTTVAAARDLVRSWNYQMGTERRNLYATRSDRFYKAYKSKFQVAYSPGFAQKEIAWEIQFVCDDPFQFEDDGFGNPAEDSAAVTLGALDSNPKSFVVTNNSDRIVFVKVDFTAGVDNLLPHTLRNVTAGLEYTYSGALAPADLLSLDFRQFTVEKNGVNALTDWNGGTLYLMPGVNNFQIEGRLGSATVSYIIKH